MRDALLIFIGSTIMTIDIKCVLDPAGLVTGGVTGLAIVIKQLTGMWIDGGIPLWISNVLLNVPIFLFAIYAEGFRSIIRTGLSWVIMSVELAIFPEVPLIADNLVLTTAYGGILFGIGTGLILHVHATSGGTDLLGKAIHHYWRSVSMGRLIQILDGAVAVIEDLSDTIVKRGPSHIFRLEFGQVDDIAGMSVLEQSGIALGCNLFNLPLYRRQIKLIFTCAHIRFHHFAIERGVHLCLVVILVVGRMMEHLVALLELAILDVPYQS